MNGEAVREAPTMMARDRHAPIVEAIERGDAAAAVTVVEQHMAAASAASHAPLDAEGGRSLRPLRHPAWHRASPAVDTTLDAALTSSFSPTVRLLTVN